MSSTSKTVAGLNGPQRVERRHGMAALRQDEAQSLAHVVVTALDEAHRIACDVSVALHKQERQIDVGEVTEALACVEAAEHYLRLLQDAVYASGGDPRDPWNSVHSGPAF